MRKIIYRTSHLFPRTSFLTGMGSIFNLSGKYFIFNYSKSSHKADSIAIENDWGVIGQDLKTTIERNPYSKLLR